MGLVILDVAIGLILVYLVLSLVSSAVTEMIAQKFKKRGRFLRQGIESLLGKRITDLFYEHRLIRNLSQKDQDPSYIPAETFAGVAMDLALNYSPEHGVQPRSGRERISRFISDKDARAKDGPTQGREAARQEAELGRTLLSFWDEEGGARDAVSGRIQTWFNDSMDRVGGWYRRWSQKVLLWTAIVIVLALNANTIQIANTLYNTPAIREAFVAEAQARAAQAEPKAVDTSDDIKREFTAVEPVLGWTMKHIPAKDAGVGGWVSFVLLTLIGCGITVLSVSMGATFWFRSLKQILRVRARVSPEEEKKPEAPAGDGPGAQGGGVAAPRQLGFQGSFDPDASRHRHANAYWLGKAAELAYQDGPAFRSAVANWGVECRFVSEGDSQAQVLASKDLMIVAFRGTETNPGDIATDVKFGLTPWEGPGEVHRGFKDALDVAWKALVEAMEELRQPGQTLWFTGHSLGGALAVLGGMRWVVQERKPSPSGVYTIGQPRVGDKAFVDAYGNALGECTFRYVNNRDAVPRVPLRVQGYDHAGTILYFDTAGALHTEPKLWFRLLDTALTDAGKAKESIKEAAGDHSAVEYVERLRRAVE